MKGLKVCLLFIAFVFAGRSFAAAGSLSITYGGSAYSFDVPSSSCADAQAALLAWAGGGWSEGTCTSDPLVVGSSVRLLLPGNFADFPVTAITATSATATPPADPASTPSGGSTAADAAALLSAVLAGFTVLAFAAGYIGGYSQ